MDSLNKETWENEKMRRAWGGTEERLVQGEIKDIAEESKQKSTLPLPKAEESHHIFAVSNAHKSLLQSFTLTWFI